jgi:hypothetical protein
MTLKCGTVSDTNSIPFMADLIGQSIEENRGYEVSSIKKVLSDKGWMLMCYDDNNSPCATFVWANSTTGKQVHEYAEFTSKTTPLSETGYSLLVIAKKGRGCVLEVREYPPEIGIPHMAKVPSAGEEIHIIIFPLESKSGVLKKNVVKPA